MSNDSDWPLMLGQSDKKKIAATMTETTKNKKQPQHTNWWKQQKWEKERKKDREEENEGKKWFSHQK